MHGADSRLGERLTPAITAAVAFLIVFSAIGLCQAGSRGETCTESHEFATLFDPSYFECREVAHMLGKVAQQGLLTREAYDDLVRAFHEPLDPTAIEVGYEYCWRCKRRCKSWCFGEACLRTDFQWRVRDYSWPKCPRAENESAEAHLPSKPPAPSLEALRSIKQKAEAGNADAQYHLGLLYFYGVGVKESSLDAAEWLGRASRQGHKEATRLLK